MISRVMIVKSGEKVKLVPDCKPTNLLYFTLMDNEIPQHPPNKVQVGSLKKKRLTGRIDLKILHFLIIKRWKSNLLS